MFYYRRFVHPDVIDNEHVFVKPRRLRLTPAGSGTAWTLQGEFVYQHRPNGDVYALHVDSWMADPSEIGVTMSKMMFNGYCYALQEWGYDCSTGHCLANK